MSKVCAIIGIGPGNGEALVRRFCAEGYQVAMLSRSENTLKDMEQAYSGATGYVCDATDSGQVRSALGRVEDDLGSIQTLVYNAGAGVFKSVEDSTEADFEHTWRVNTLGLAMATKAALPQLRKHDQANIMVTGASAAWRGRANTCLLYTSDAADE